MSIPVPGRCIPATRTGRLPRFGPIIRYASCRSLALSRAVRSADSIVVLTRRRRTRAFIVSTLRSITR